MANKGASSRARRRAAAEARVEAVRGAAARGEAEEAARAEAASSGAPFLIAVASWARRAADAREAADEALLGALEGVARARARCPAASQQLARAAARAAGRRAACVAAVRAARACGPAEATAAARLVAALAAREAPPVLAVRDAVAWCVEAAPVAAAAAAGEMCGAAAALLAHPCVAVRRLAAHAVAAAEAAGRGGPPPDGPARALRRAAAAAAHDPCAAAAETARRLLAERFGRAADPAAEAAADRAAAEVLRRRPLAPGFRGRAFKACVDALGGGRGPPRAALDAATASRRLDGAGASAALDAAARRAAASTRFAWLVAADECAKFLVHSRLRSPFGAPPATLVAVARLVRLAPDPRAALEVVEALERRALAAGAAFGVPRRTLDAVFAGMRGDQLAAAARARWPAAFLELAGRAGGAASEDEGRRAWLLASRARLHVDAGDAAGLACLLRGASTAPPPWRAAAELHAAQRFEAAAEEYARCARGAAEADRVFVARGAAACAALLGTDAARRAAAAAAAAAPPCPPDDADSDAERACAALARWSAPAEAPPEARPCLAPAAGPWKAALAAGGGRGPPQATPEVGTPDALLRQCMAVRSGAAPPAALAAAALAPDGAPLSVAELVAAARCAGGSDSELAFHAAAAAAAAGNAGLAASLGVPAAEAAWLADTSPLAHPRRAADGHVRFLAAEGLAPPPCPAEEWSPLPALGGDAEAAVAGAHARVVSALVGLSALPDARAGWAAREAARLAPGSAAAVAAYALWCQGQGGSAPLAAEACRAWQRALRLAPGREEDELALVRLVATRGADALDGAPPGGRPPALPHAVPQLVDHLSHPDARVRDWAAAALAAVSRGGGTHRSEGAAALVFAVEAAAAAAAAAHKAKAGHAQQLWSDLSASPKWGALASGAARLADAMRAVAARPADRWLEELARLEADVRHRAAILRVELAAASAGERDWAFLPDQPSLEVPQGAAGSADDDGGGSDADGADDGDANDVDDDEGGGSEGPGTGRSQAGLLGASQSPAPAVAALAPGAADGSGKAAQLYALVMAPAVAQLSAVWEDTCVGSPFGRRHGAALWDLVAQLASPEDASRPAAAARRVLERSAAVRARIEADGGHRPRLAHISPALAAWPDARGTLPGMPAGTRVAGFDPLVTVIRSRTRPKKVGVRCSDGVTRVYLLKSSDDLRADARAMQVARLAERAPCAQEWRGRCGPARPEPELAGASAGLAVRYRRYAVVPLGPRAGLLEWVGGARPLHEVAGGSAAVHEYRRHAARLLCGGGSEAAAARPALPRARWPAGVARAAFDAMASAPGTRAASDSLRDALRRSACGLDDAWRKPRQLAVSAGLASAVGHALGLGDRHLGNILADCREGELVHIDYSVLFDAGRRLRVPERVRFRLTPVLGRALGGGRGTEPGSLFGLSLAAGLSRLQRRGPAVCAVVEPFLHAPLPQWSRSSRLVPAARELDARMAAVLLDSRAAAAASTGCGDARVALVRLSRLLEAARRVPGDAPDGDVAAAAAAREEAERAAAAAAEADEARARADDRARLDAEARALVRSQRGLALVAASLSGLAAVAAVPPRRAAQFESVLAALGGAVRPAAEWLWRLHLEGRPAAEASVEVAGPPPMPAAPGAAPLARAVARMRAAGPFAAVLGDGGAEEPAVGLFCAAVALGGSDPPSRAAMARTLAEAEGGGATEHGRDTPGDTVVGALAARLGALAAECGAPARAATECLGTTVRFALGNVGHAAAVASLDRFVGECGGGGGGGDGGGSSVPLPPPKDGRPAAELCGALAAAVAEARRFVTGALGGEDAAEARALLAVDLACAAQVLALVRRLSRPAAGTSEAARAAEVAAAARAESDAARERQAAAEADLEVGGLDRAEVLRRLSADAVPAAVAAWRAAWPGRGSGTTALLDALARAGADHAGQAVDAARELSEGLEALADAGDDGLLAAAWLHFPPGRGPAAVFGAVSRARARVHAACAAAAACGEWNGGGGSGGNDDDDHDERLPTHRTVLALGRLKARLRRGCSDADRLAREAADPDRLCAMYEGWAPWI